MTDDLWRAAYRLFEEACERPDAERAAWVKAHAPHAEVREQVLTMLQDLEDGPAPQAPPEATVEDSTPRLAGSSIGKFEVERLLGRGGMGYVYSAIDVELHRRVALKFFQPGTAGDSSAVESLLPEAQAVSALNHPNIVTLYEVIRTPTECAIVMELVDGQSFRELSNTPRGVDEVAAWGAQIARGLAVAHRQGIVHRDIKPENLMLRSDGLVKILDFGLARKTGTGGDPLPLGTPGYMSPEQLRCGDLTPATDIFSLGVVLWELARGEHPFQPAATGAFLSTVDGGQPVAPGPGGKLSKPLERLLRRLLSKEPSARPDAESLIRLLEDLAGRQSRRTWTTPLAAAAALVAAATVWVFGPGFSPAPTPTITHFAAYAGDETDPQFSPDGSRLAFAWTGESGKSRNIYVRPLDSEQLTALTNGDLEAFAPVWSPDSQRVAFLRRSAGSSNPAVMIVPAQGGEPRMVGTIANPEGYPRPVAWWPDGKSVVVRDAGSRGIALTRLDLATGSKMALTGPASDESDGLPVLSPSGDRFAFVRLRVNSASLCLLAVAGGVKCLHTVARGAGDSINGLIHGVAWSRDGKALYYADKVAIWRLPIRPFANPQKLFDGSFTGLSSDPRAPRLVFTRQIWEQKLWAVEPGKAAARKLPGSNGSEEEPVFSPDGHRLCFRSNRTGSYELWSSAPDGSSPRRITSFQGHVGSARYSPDGQWIAFDGYGSPAEKTNHTNIYVVRSEGGAVRRMTDDRAEYLVPNWSHDQRWIYYMSQGGPRSETWRTPFPAGTPVLVAASGMFDVSESDDGKYLYYAKRAGAAGVFRMPAGGGTEEILPGTAAVRTIRFWQPSRHGLYFASGPVDATLQFLDWKTGRIRTVCPLPGKFERGPRGLAISPDESRVVYVCEDLEMGNIDLLEKIE